MTIPAIVIPGRAQLAAFAYNFPNWSNTTPFTYQDGVTNAKLVESLIAYVDKTLVPYVDDEMREILEAWEQTVLQILNAFDDAVSEIVNSSVELQDVVLRGILSNLSSETRIFLDSIYASKSVQTIVETGRLSKASLDEDYASKSVQTIVETGRLSKASLDEDYASKSVQTIMETGRLSETELNATFASKDIVETGRLSVDNLYNTIIENISRTILNVKNFGLKGDGVTDDTTALVTLIESLPVLGNNGNKALYFPAGRYVLNNSFAFYRTISVYGDGPYTTEVIRNTGSVGDLFTFNSVYSNIFNLSINSSNATDGDDIVLNASYAGVFNVASLYSAGTALRVGKASRSLAHRINNVIIRAPKLHCAHISPAGGSDSTDGIWSNCDFGTAGLSGLLIECSAQNMSNVHVWGCGTALNDEDSHGFYVKGSSGHLFSTCQAETCWGDGFKFENSNVNGSELGQCKSWSNGWSGFNIVAYHRLSLSTAHAYDNGLRNVNGVGTDSMYSGYRNEGSSFLALNGARSYDRAVAKTLTAPSPPMGRGAYVTQVFDYIEIGSTVPYGNTFTGCSFRRDGGIVMLGNGSAFSSNVISGLHPRVASGASVPCRSWHSVIEITGNSAVNTISSGIVGQVVTLKFIDSAVVQDIAGGNIDMSNGQMNATPGSWINFRFNGSRWMELSRKVV